ncbi:MAG: hypothetical protein AAGC53_20435 [Actinomycetota bacterium]
MTTATENDRTLGSLFLELEKLGDESLDSFGGDDEHLYVHGHPSTWSGGSPCALVGLDPFREEPPELVVGEVVFVYALPVFDAVDVFRNLSVAGRSSDRFARAVAHYLEFDGFVSE